MKKLLLTLFLIFSLFACGEEQKTEELQEPSVVNPEPVAKLSGAVLAKADFANLASWKQDDVKMAAVAFKRSCEKIKFEKNEFLSNSQIKIPTKLYHEVCNKYQGQDFRKYLEENFEPYLVMDGDNPDGKFTSYYESEIFASYHKDSEYKYPIYGKPNDLIEFNLADFAPELGSKRFVGRIENKKLVPYYSRAQIEKNGLLAPVILWANSNVDIYVMQIQGSAVAKLPDGTEVRVGYADNNGLNFRGIGSILLEKGIIKPGHGSMDKVKKWLVENYETAKEHMFENKRYTFHRIVEAPGAIGAQNVPLIEGRSLAVDRTYVPLGALLWLETTGPDREKIEKLVVAQDVGGAIKGVVRGDYFWGSGEAALEHAGRMNSKGRYFILIPKGVKIN